MDIQQVIANLEAAKEPTRNLDGQIALAMGYTRQRQAFVDASGNDQIRSQFFHPKTGKPTTVPYYTTDLDEAYELSAICAPALPVAVSWDETGGEAIIEGYPRSRGCTTAVALCISSLVAKKRGME